MRQGVGGLLSHYLGLISAAGADVRFIFLVPRWARRGHLGAGGHLSKFRWQQRHRFTSERTAASATATAFQISPPGSQSDLSKTQIIPCRSLPYSEPLNAFPEPPGFGLTLQAPRDLTPQTRPLPSPAAHLQTAEQWTPSGLPCPIPLSPLHFPLTAFHPGPWIQKSSICGSPKFSSGLDFSHQLQNNISNCLLDSFAQMSKTSQTQLSKIPIPPDPLTLLVFPTSVNDSTIPAATSVTPDFSLSDLSHIHPPSAPAKSCWFYHQSSSNVHPFSPSNMSPPQPKPRFPPELHKSFPSGLPMSVPLRHTVTQ